MAMSSSVASSVAVSSVQPAGRIGRNSSGFPPRHVSVSAAANYGKIPSASMDVRKCRQAEDDVLVGRSSNKWSMNDEIPKVLSTVTAFGATALLTSTFLNVEVAYALDGVQVGSLFERSCSGCHTGGGNVLQPSATLFNKDLDSNGVSSVDDIFKITYFGKNRMPGYGEKCTPRGQCTFGPRLGEDQIRALAEFVKSQADQGWINVPS